MQHIKWVMAVAILGSCFVINVPSGVEARSDLVVGSGELSEAQKQKEVCGKLRDECKQSCKRNYDHELNLAREEAKRGAIATIIFGESADPQVELDAALEKCKGNCDEDFTCCLEQQDPLGCFYGI